LPLAKIRARTGAIPGRNWHSLVGVRWLLGPQRGYAWCMAAGDGERLLTVGHGTASADELLAVLRGAGVELVVDVRTAPGSRRHPQFNRHELEHWLPAAGIRYRWEGDLGGFRRPSPESPNVALRHPSFRGYADYMCAPAFDDALGRVLDDARDETVTVMCSESLWWRCHRRLVADAAVLRFGFDVRHLGHDGRLSAHRLTDGVRLAEDGRLVYDSGEPPLPLES
jgi:uncharacterized protein (DUF488 family)